MKKIIATILIVFSLGSNAATIYIDPTNKAAGQNGTIQNPFDSWTDFSFQNGNSYLQKKGTTYTSANQIYINNKTDVIIGAYGTGLRAKFSFTGHGYAFRIEASHFCAIRDFEVNGNVNAHSLIAVIGTQANYLNFNSIIRCSLSNAHNTNNAGFGIYANCCNQLLISKTTISNVALDGIYLANTPGIEIGYCNVYDINKRYFLNKNQTYSSGDGIQFDGNYNNFNLHHTIVQRTNKAGNKFNVIFNSSAGTSDNANGIIEYCLFITDNTVTCAIHIERGNGIIVRYNSFLGVTDGIRIAGRYSNNIQVYNNTFENCDRGIGVGSTWVSGVPYPATGTKIYNNHFTSTGRFQIWIDRTRIEVCNNTGDGVPIYNYGGGSWVTMSDCN